MDHSCNVFRMFNTFKLCKNICKNITVVSRHLIPIVMLFCDIFLGELEVEMNARFPKTNVV